MLLRLTAALAAIAWAAVPALAAQTANYRTAPFPIAASSEVVVGYANTCPTTSTLKVKFSNAYDGTMLKSAQLTLSVGAGRAINYRASSNFALFTAAVELICPFDPPGKLVGVTVRDDATEIPLVAIPLLPDN